MARLTCYDKGNDEILIIEEEKLLATKGFVTEEEMQEIVNHLKEKLFKYEELATKIDLIL